MVFNTTIAGIPVGKGRPRFRIFQGHVSTYTPAKTKKAEQEIIRQLQETYNVPPLTGPLKVSFKFYMPMPKSWSRKKKESMIEEFCTTKPDLDNLIKTYCDAMNGVVFEDDKQIVMVTAFKVYSYEPKTDITVMDV